MIHGRKEEAEVQQYWIMSLWPAHRLFKSCLNVSIFWYFFSSFQISFWNTLWKWGFTLLFYLDLNDPFCYIYHFNYYKSLVTLKEILLMPCFTHRLKIFRKMNIQNCLVPFHLIWYVFKENTFPEHTVFINFSHILKYMLPLIRLVHITSWKAFLLSVSVCHV